MSPFDYTGYLELSRALNNRTPKGVTDEAAWRTAVSRAYYAAYHSALTYSAKLPDPVAPAGRSLGPHEKVIKAFLGCPRQSLGYMVGSELNDLKVQRVHADYKSTPGVTQADVAIATVRAAQLLTDIASLP